MFVTQSRCRDPALLNTIAKKREVILFDNRGVGRTQGEVPDSNQAWADDMVAFVQGLGLKKLDLLGFSMGSRVGKKTIAWQVLATFMS